MDLAKSNDIIHSATSSSEALRGLYQLAKQGNKNRSLAYYCKRAGIPSTGYFSDVLSGKRTISAKYRIAIARAFDLSSAAAACLRLLIDIDNATLQERIAALRIKLSANKKLLKISYLALPTESTAPIGSNDATDDTDASDARALFEALDVFCAFGLFRNRPSKAELQGYFTQPNAPNTDKSLRLLASLGLIKEDGDRYTVLLDHVIFGSEKGRISHIDFLKMAIAHASENVAAWFGRTDQAYFTSTVASVKRESYAAALQDLKTKMLLTQSELGSDEADMLVRFNVQIYPIGSRSD